MEFGRKERRKLRGCLVPVGVLLAIGSGLVFWRMSCVHHQGQVVRMNECRSQFLEACKGLRGQVSTGADQELHRKLAQLEREVQREDLHERWHQLLAAAVTLENESNASQEAAGQTRSPSEQLLSGAAAKAGDFVRRNAKSMRKLAKAMGGEE